MSKWLKNLQMSLRQFSKKLFTDHYQFFEQDQWHLLHCVDFIRCHLKTPTLLNKSNEHCKKIFFWVWLNWPWTSHLVLMSLCECFTALIIIIYFFFLAFLFYLAFFFPLQHNSRISPGGCWVAWWDLSWWNGAWKDGGSVGSYPVSHTRRPGAGDPHHAHGKEEEAAKV